MEEKVIHNESKKLTKTPDEPVIPARSRESQTGSCQRSL